MRTCSLFLSLALCTPLVLGATFPAAPDITVYFNPTGTTTTSCGGPTNPCSSLSDFILNTAKANPSRSYKLLLNPGEHLVGPTGLDVTNLRLRIQPAADVVYPGAASASINCAAAACLFADCVLSANTSSCLPDAVLEIIGISVLNGVSNTDGGCIRVQGQSLALKYASLSNCSAARSGGAILANQAPALDIMNLTLTTSTANAGDGGGLALVNVSEASIFGLVASRCSAPEGSGGIVNATASQLTISGSTLSSSTAGVNGGCLSTHGSTVTISNSTLSKCTALAFGGCLWDHLSSSVAITGSTLTECALLAPFISAEAGGSGGCVATFDTSLVTVESSTLYRCRATQEAGCMLLVGANVTQQEVKISKTTVEGCNLTTAAGRGGGVYANTLKLAVLDSVFTDNMAWGIAPGSEVTGGAIETADCYVDIQRCNFTRNSASDFEFGNAWGGAIHTVDYSSIGPYYPNSIVDCRFDGNYADIGGALYLSANEVATVANCVFDNNTALVGKAGAFLVSMFGNTTDCTFTNNKAVEGGALHIPDTAVHDVKVSRSNFSGNVASLSTGGAVSIEESCDFPIVFEGCRFSGNSAPLDAGGAVSTSAMFVHFKDCVFEENSAHLKGGAVSTGGRDKFVPGSADPRPATGNTTLEGCTFVENQATLGGGAVYVAGQGLITSVDCEFAGNSGVLGGAILAEDYSSLLISGGSCSSNRAVAAGGCFTVGEQTNTHVQGLVLSNNSAGSEGGALRTTGEAAMTLENCTLRGNTATQGGGIWIEMNSISTVTGSIFEDNKADLNGGGLFVLHSAYVVLEGSDFISNTALRGGALAAEGTVHINITSCRFTSNAIHAVEFEGGVIARIENSSFSNNNGSSFDGGAFITGDTSVVTLSSSNFTNNIGNRGAGIFANGNSTVSVDGCDFVGNMATRGAGIFAGGFANVNTTNCLFDSNNATQSGAGIALTESTRGTLAHSSFVANSASSGGAAVFIIRGPTANSAGAAASLLLPRSNDDGSPSSAQGNKASAANAEAIDDVIEPLQITSLTFNSNQGVSSQGSAYMDASFEDSTRSTCASCSAMKRGDSIGTLPEQFRMLWPGSNDSNPSAPFIVRGDKFSPITGLKIQVLDADGALATEDFSAVASVQPSPVVSGVLHGVAVRGETEMPPLYIFQAPSDGSSSANLTLILSSSTGAFPPIARQLLILFCPAGEFFQKDTMTCVTCPVGSWCGTALGAQKCEDGTLSFFPGATSSASCLTCPKNEFANGTQAVLCTEGILTVEPGWWMDPNSVYSGVPAVYSCDVLDGCGGFDYSTPDQSQCSAGYSQVRLCSTCEQGFYSVLKECYQCQPTFTKLFPLFVVLMLLAWFLMGFLSNALHTVAIFVIEIQLLTFIGTYNLLLPTWVTSIIQYFQIFLFIPDIIGPPCTVTYNFPEKWAVAMIIPAAGLVVFSILYGVLEGYILFLEYSSRANANPYMLADRTESSRSLEDGATAVGAPVSQRGGINGSGRDVGSLTSRTEPGAPPGPDIAAKQERYSKWRNSLVHSCTNWLDLCYAGVTYRCLQAFYPQFYGATVMGAAPTIGWFSPSHTLIFSLSVVIALVFVVGAPLGYAVVLTWGKLRVLLSDPIFKRRWGWMISRYEYDYFWWHLTVFARRISFASIAVFGVHSPEVQLAVTISLQAVRIGLQYGASPFKAFSHDILNSLFALAEFLFTIALASFHYLDLEDASVVVFGFSMGLLLAPTVIILFYEALNKYIDHCNYVSITNLWRLDKLGKSTKSLRRLNRLTIDELVHPRDIAEWFRPHVLFAFLRHASHKEARILLKVRDRYEACKLAGLGRTDWIKHLTKSQLYAVVSQALLGAAVGEVTIAKMPVRSGAGGEGINEVRIEAGVSTADGQSLRPRNEVTWPPRLEDHVRWTGSGRTTDGASSTGTSMRYDPSVSESEGGPQQRQQHLRQSSSGSEAVLTVDGSAPVPLPQPVADFGDETQRHEARDSVPEMRRSTSVASGRAGSDAGWLSPLQAGSSNQSPLSSSPAAAATGLPPRPPSATVARKTGLPPRGPSPLGLAPSGTPAAPESVHEDQDAASALGEAEGEEEFLEARMNMADLTLTFQRHLALLVRAEFGKSDDSLRLLLRSDCLPLLLGWLTSPAGTAEDQVLVREMVNVVREGAREEAGGLVWYTGLLYFLKNMWHSKQGYEPTLADISSR